MLGIQGVTEWSEAVFLAPRGTLLNKCIPDLAFGWAVFLCLMFLAPENLSSADAQAHGKTFLVVVFAMLSSH